MPSDKRARQRAARQASQEAAQATQRRRRQRNLLIRGVMAAAVLVAVVFVITRVQGGEESVSTEATTTPTTAKTQFGSGACPKTDGSSPRKEKFDAPPMRCIDLAKKYKATMETDAGTITLALDPARAPVTVNNFVVLARYHYFDGITFHRVIPGFVIQGGDPEGTGSGGPGYEFADELPKSEDYKEGSLAMANSGPNTNGSQFFIVVSDSGGKQLSAAVGGTANYSLFGEVEAGMDIVRKIEADGSSEGKPSVVHKMTKVTITEA